MILGLGVPIEDHCVNLVQCEFVTFKSQALLDFINKIVFVFIDLSFKTNKERNGVIMRGNWQEKGNYVV